MGDDDGALRSESTRRASGWLFIVVVAPCLQQCFLVLLRPLVVAEVAGCTIGCHVSLAQSMSAYQVDTGSRHPAASVLHSTSAARSPLLLASVVDYNCLDLQVRSSSTLEGFKAGISA